MLPVFHKFFCPLGPDLGETRDRIKMFLFFEFMDPGLHSSGSQESIAKKVFRKSNGKLLFQTDFDLGPYSQMTTKMAIS